MSTYGYVTTMKCYLIAVCHCVCVCVLLTITVRCRKFLQMSYIAYGSGPDSRNAQFVVHQCVGILYAMRVFFLHHCLQVVHCSRVDEPERISRLYLNGQKSSSFTAIQNIKRPAKLDIQKVSSTRICHHIPGLILCRETPDLGSYRFQSHCRGNGFSEEHLRRGATEENRAHRATEEQQTWNK